MTCLKHVGHRLIDDVRVPHRLLIHDVSLDAVRSWRSSKIHTCIRHVR